MTESDTDPTLLGEISHGPSAFEQFLEKNQKLLALLAIITALALGAYVVMQTIKNDNAKEAGALLSSATDEAGLQKVISMFPDAPAASTAALTLAQKLWDSGKQDDAIAALKNLIAKNDESPVSATAQMSLAKYLHAQGKTSEAKQAYEAVATSTQAANFYAPAALIALGDLAKKEGDLKTAEAQYKKVRADFSESVFAKEATARIDLLNFKAPTEIDAPAPAPVINEPPSSIITPDEPAPANEQNENPLIKDIINTNN